MFRLLAIVFRFFLLGGLASRVSELPLGCLPLSTLVLPFFCDLVPDDLLVFLSLFWDLHLSWFLAFVYRLLSDLDL